MLLLYQEAQENPTKNTLRKAIEGNYPHMVKSLLKRGIIADKEDLKVAIKLEYQEIGCILRNYLGADTGQALISKSGIVGIYEGIDQDLARRIMSYIL
jgi:hypothetical protein